MDYFGQKPKIFLVLRIGFFLTFWTLVSQLLTKDLKFQTYGLVYKAYTAPDFKNLQYSDLRPKTRRLVI